MIDRSEELVTVFGGSGFIGRYVCELLMKSGVRVRVATRGGALTIGWEGEGQPVRMKGPATTVFEGRWEVPPHAIPQRGGR